MDRISVFGRSPVDDAKSGEDLGLPTLQTLLPVIPALVTTAASLDGDIPPYLRRNNFVVTVEAEFWFEHDARSSVTAGDSTSTSGRNHAERRACSNADTAEQITTLV